MTYNMSFTEGSSITGLFSGVNDNSGGLFAGLLLLSIFIIVIIATRTDDFKKKVLTGSFITSIVGGVMFFMGWIAGEYAITATVLLLISAFIMVWAE